MATALMYPNGSRLAYLSTDRELAAQSVPRLESSVRRMLALLPVRASDAAVFADTPVTVEGEAAWLCVRLAAAMELPIVSHTMVVGAITDALTLSKTVDIGTLAASVAATPEVERILLHADLAEGLREKLPAVRVIGVHRVDELLVEVLDLDRQLENPALWSDIADGALVERLFRAALRGSSIPIGWPAVASAALGLLRTAHEWTSVERSWLEMAHAIARRHAGEGVVLRWPADLHVLPRRIRLEVAAHVVQSAADGDLEAVNDYVERAEGLIAPSLDRDVGDLKLLGAMGRALMAVGSYKTAAIWLDRALSGWSALHLTADSSYALCERLRCAGIQGDGVALAELCDRATAFLGDPEVTAGSIAFVALAAGRGLVLDEQWAKGVAWLERSDVLWDSAEAHVRSARLRLLHVAFMGLWDKRAAKRALDQIGDCGQGRLARLDTALAFEEPLQGPLDALLDDLTWGAEARRTWSRLGPHVNAETVGRLVREFRY